MTEAVDLGRGLIGLGRHLLNLTLDFGLPKISHRINLDLNADRVVVAKFHSKSLHLFDKKAHFIEQIL